MIPKNWLISPLSIWILRPKKKKIPTFVIHHTIHARDQKYQKCIIYKKKKNFPWIYPCQHFLPLKNKTPGVLLTYPCPAPKTKQKNLENVDSKETLFYLRKLKQCFSVQTIIVWHSILGPDDKVPVVSYSSESRLNNHIFLLLFEISICLFLI